VSSLSGRAAEPGTGDVVVDVPVDGVRRVAEFGGCLGLAGGQQRAE